MQRFLGKCVAFQYPRHNYAGVPSKTEQRRLLVQHVRDCEAEPLLAESIGLNPHCKRGRWLVTGLDLDRGDERSFWWESMSGVDVVELRRVRGRPPRVARFMRDGSHVIKELYDARDVYCETANSFCDGTLTVPVG